MKVLYLVNYAGEGGSEKYVLDLAGSFSKSLGQAFFIYNRAGRLCQRMEALDIESAQVEMKNPFDLRAAGCIAGYCVQWEIDLIHTQFQRENYIALLVKKLLKKKRPNLKVVYTCHINLKNNLLWKMMNLCMGKHDDAVIAVCQEGKRLLIENNMPASKITVIPNGVSLKESPAKGGRCDNGVSLKGSPAMDRGGDPGAIREEFHIPGSAFLFVSLTRFTPEKGTAFLLRAVRRLADETDLPFRVLLAGEGELWEELRQYVAVHHLEEQVIFAGYRTDPDNLLAAAQAFINSSQSEASSFAILEAMSGGLPIIATAIGGNVDIVNEENDCGLLVEYGDEEGLAQAMKRLMEDRTLADRLGRNARRTVEDRFTIEKTRADTFAIYTHTQKDVPARSPNLP